jgi:hypothetical protein
MYKIKAVPFNDDKIVYYVYNCSTWNILTLHRYKPITKILFLKGYILEPNVETEITEDVYKILISFCTPK